MVNQKKHTRKYGRKHGGAQDLAPVPPMLSPIGVPPPGRCVGAYLDPVSGKVVKTCNPTNKPSKGGGRKRKHGGLRPGPGPTYSQDPDPLWWRRLVPLIPPRYRKN